MLGTYPYAEALAEEELPILRALGREEHAGHEHHRGDEYGKPKVPSVQQSPDGQSRSVKHSVLSRDQRPYGVKQGAHELVRNRSMH